MNISVVIPAYNEEKTLPACLESLCNQETARAFEVIVVDNNSSDATAEVALSYTDRLAIRVLQQPMQGRGAARKMGWDAATGDIIFSTDADATVPSDWLEEFSTILEDNDEIVGVCSSVRINDCGRVRNIAFNVFHPLFMRSYKLLFKHHLLCGFSFALKKDAYRASEGFDERNNGQEDVDLSKKIAPLGKTYFCKETPVCFSGRRFQQGLCKGMYEYVHTYIRVSVKGDTDFSLPDYR